MGKLTKRKPRKFVGKTAVQVYPKIRDEFLDLVDDAAGPLSLVEGQSLLAMLMEDLSLRHDEFVGYYGKKRKR